MTNPTASISLDFAAYVAARAQQMAQHQDGRVPDYAFSLDKTLHQQLAAIAPVRALARLLLGVVVELQKQEYLSSGIRVGPQQLPHLHAIAVDCARRFGTHVPEIYISPEPILNAFTIGVDNTSSVIVISADLIRALNEQELRFVIGHECGHIHNEHGIYGVMIQLMTNPLAQTFMLRLWRMGIGGQFLNLATTVFNTAMQVLMARWSRCAEITCDRAGLICCGDVAAAQSALLKIVTGGAALLDGINFEAYAQQVSSVQAPGKRLRELLSTHPITPRRVEALHLFTESEVYFKWHPDRQPSVPLRSKAEIDQDCERIIGVLMTGL